MRSCDTIMTKPKSKLATYQVMNGAEDEVAGLLEEVKSVRSPKSLTQKKRRGPIRGIVQWWKRRHFYVSQNESQDSERHAQRDMTMEASSDESDSVASWDMESEAPSPIVEDVPSPLPQVSVAASEVSAWQLKVEISPSLEEVLMGSRIDSALQPPVLHARQRHDSFQESLESMDSLAESYWDPEDDNSSNCTPLAKNSLRPSNFLAEHMRFLRVQTQPRQVETMWSTPMSM